MNTKKRSLTFELFNKRKYGSYINVEIHVPSSAPSLMNCSAGSLWNGSRSTGSRSHSKCHPAPWSYAMSVAGGALSPSPHHSSGTGSQLPSYRRLLIPPTHSLIKPMLEWFGRAKTLPLSLRFASQIPYFIQPLNQQYLKEVNVPIHLLAVLSPHLSVLDLAMSWAPFFLEYVSHRPGGPHFQKLESLILMRTNFVDIETRYRCDTPYSIPKCKETVSCDVLPYFCE